MTLSSGEGLEEIKDSPKGANGMFTDIYESPTEIVAVIEIPGVQDKKDIKIGIENNILTINGKLEKSFNLPCPINEEVIRTYYENGILEIRLQKTISDNKNIEINIH